MKSNWFHYPWTDQAISRKKNKIKLQIGAKPFGHLQADELFTALQAQIHFRFMDEFNWATI